MLYIFCIKTEATRGSNTMNPLKFETMPVQEAYISINGRYYPSEGYKCLDENGRLRAYDTVCVKIRNFFSQFRSYMCVCVCI